MPNASICTFLYTSCTKQGGKVWCCTIIVIAYYFFTGSDRYETVIGVKNDTVLTNEYYQCWVCIFSIIKCHTILKTIGPKQASQKLTYEIN